MQRFNGQLHTPKKMFYLIFFSEPREGEADGAATRVDGQYHVETEKPE